MKLCIIVANSLRKDPRVIKQIQCAKEAGIKVYFIGFMDENYDENFLNHVDCNVSMVDFGAKFTGHLKSPFKLIYREFLHYYLPIKLLLKIKPDVIHANDFNTLVQAYIASRIIKSKVVYDSHEICAESLGISKKKIRKNTIIAVEHLLLKRIGAMISVSNAAAEYFNSKYKIPLPTVITNCPYKPGIILKEKKNYEVFEVLYHGQLYEGRGYEEFVRSAKFINKNIRMVVRGYGRIEEKLKEIVDANQLGEKVRFDEPVEIKELIKKAAESDLGVVLTEPININFELTVSNKIFEYIHAGLPVLMSDVPEHRYLNNQFNFGIIVRDFSPVGIAKCINDLVKDVQLYELLKSNAIKAAKILCWENESKKLISIYRKLAKEKLEPIGS